MLLHLKLSGVRSNCCCRVDGVDFTGTSRYTSPQQGHRKGVRGPVKKIFRAPSKGGVVRNLYTKSEKTDLQLQCHSEASHRHTNTSLRQTDEANTGPHILMLALHNNPSIKLILQRVTVLGKISGH
jgi:hypothetical protein